MSNVTKVIFKCPSCKHKMTLRPEDYWGKMIICYDCTADVANNMFMRFPDDFQNIDNDNIVKVITQ